MEEIKQAVYSAIDEYNAIHNTKMKKSPNTSLLGSKSELDSIGLVSLIVAVEDKLRKALHRPITIISDKAFSHKHSPFSTVRSFSQYLEEICK